MQLGELRRAGKLEEEAAQFEAQGKFAESERASASALEIYRAVAGPESVATARVWSQIGRVASGKATRTVRKRRSSGQSLLDAEPFPMANPLRRMP